MTKKSKKKIIKEPEKRVWFGRFTLKDIIIDLVMLVILGGIFYYYV